MIIDQGAVILNDTTGHGVRNIQLAKDYFESIGYLVVRTETVGNLPNYLRWPFN